MDLSRLLPHGQPLPSAYRNRAAGHFGGDELAERSIYPEDQPKQEKGGASLPGKVQVGPCPEGKPSARGGEVHSAEPGQSENRQVSLGLEMEQFRGDRWDGQAAGVPGDGLDTGAIREDPRHSEAEIR